MSRDRSSLALPAGRLRSIRRPVLVVVELAPEPSIGQLQPLEVGLALVAQSRQRPAAAREHQPAADHHDPEERDVRMTLRVGDGQLVTTQEDDGREAEGPEPQGELLHLPPGASNPLSSRSIS